MIRKDIKRRGLLLVLSSPSGAGKTTIARRLLADDKSLKPSVSVTTRAPRADEVDGVDYYFVSMAKFKKLNDNNMLLESAQVFGNYYGTPTKHVMDMLDRGYDVLFDIDWQGAQQLAQKISEHLVRIFILPPSIDALEQRLRLRKSDSEGVIIERMSKAKVEMSHWAEYDWVLINDEITETTGKIQTVLESERIRRIRQINMQQMVEEILSDGDETVTCSGSQKINCA